MKTLVTLLKLAMLVTTLSFVMSCDKANKKTNNTAIHTGVYQYGANGTCLNTQTGQQMPITYCQQQTGGYGSQQCNGNSTLYVFIRGQQQYCSTDQRSYSDFMQYGGCWISCSQMSCSGQIAYPAGAQQGTPGVQCLQFPDLDVLPT